MLKVIEVECPYTPRGVLENERNNWGQSKLNSFTKNLSLP